MMRAMTPRRVRVQSPDPPLQRTAAAAIGYSDSDLQRRAVRPGVSLAMWAGLEPTPPSTMGQSQLLREAQPMMPPMLNANAMGRDGLGASMTDFRARVAPEYGNPYPEYGNPYQQSAMANSMMEALESTVEANMQPLHEVRALSPAPRARLNAVGLSARDAPSAYNTAGSLMSEAYATGGLLPEAYAAGLQQEALTTPTSSLYATEAYNNTPPGAVYSQEAYASQYSPEVPRAMASNGQQITVALDVDEVLCRYVDGFRKWLQRERPTGPLDTDSVFREAHDPNSPWRLQFALNGGLDNLEAVPGAVPALRKLKQAGVRLEVVTSRPPTMRESTEALLAKIFPPDTFSAYHFVGPGEKGRTCNAIRALALVDDQIPNVVDASACGVVAVLFNFSGTYPWAVCTQDELPAGVMRLETWSATCDYLLSVLRVNVGSSMSMLAGGGAVSPNVSPPPEMRRATVLGERRAVSPGPPLEARRTLTDLRTAPVTSGVGERRALSPGPIESRRTVAELQGEGRTLSHRPVEVLPLGGYASGMDKVRAVSPGPPVDRWTAGEVRAVSPGPPMERRLVLGDRRTISPSPSEVRRRAATIAGPNLISSTGLPTTGVPMMEQVNVIDPVNMLERPVASGQSAVILNPAEHTSSPSRPRTPTRSAVTTLEGQRRNGWADAFQMQQQQQKLQQQQQQPQYWPAQQLPGQAPYPATTVLPGGTAPGHQPGVPMFGISTTWNDHHHERDETQPSCVIS